MCLYVLYVFFVIIFSSILFSSITYALFLNFYSVYTLYNNNNYNFFDVKCFFVYYENINIIYYILNKQKNTFFVGDLSALLSRIVVVLLVSFCG